MNAKNRFDETLERCEKLIELFDKEQNGDLLRSVVVFAVAALDKYCKDRFMEFFESYYEGKAHGRNLCKDCKDYLAKADVTAEYMLSVYQEKEENPLLSPAHIISEKLKEHLYRSTFQSSDAITELFQCFGLKEIIKNAVGKAQSENVLELVERMIYRRHRIAHTADYGKEMELKEIRKAEVESWLLSLNDMVNSLDSILENRFRNYNAVLHGDNNGVSLAEKPLLEFMAQFHKNNGYLDVGELSCLRRIADIEELFGVKAKRRGFLCEGSVDCPSMGDSVEIWWPKIASEPNYAGWKNEPCYNADAEIVEVVEQNASNWELNDKVLNDNCEKNRLRIVLAVVEGDSCVVGYCYRFLGTFTLDIAASKERMACVWKRKDARVELKKSQTEGV